VSENEHEGEEEDGIEMGEGDEFQVSEILVKSKRVSVALKYLSTKYQKLTASLLG
jgi:hypothetical protein